MRCAYAPRVMRAADGGGYVSIQGSVCPRLEDTVLLCGAQATGALKTSKCM